MRSERQRVKIIVAVAATGLGAGRAPAVAMAGVDGFTPVLDNLVDKPGFSIPQQTAARGETAQVRMLDGGVVPGSCPAPTPAPKSSAVGSAPTSTR